MWFLREISGVNFLLNYVGESLIWKGLHVIKVNNLLEKRIRTIENLACWIFSYYQTTLFRDNEI